MTSSRGVIHDGRGKFRQAIHPSRTSATALPLPVLRDTAATAAAAPPSQSLFSSIQSRPLQANPAAPLLWNSGSSTTTASTNHNRRHSEVGYVGATLPYRAGSTPSSSVSTPRSSVPGDSLGGEHGSRRLQRGSGGSDNRGGAITHAIQPHRPAQDRTTPLTRAPASPPPALATVTGRADRGKKVTAVNYNALLEQEQSKQQQQTTAPSPSTSPVPLAPKADLTERRHSAVFMYRVNSMGEAQTQESGMSSAAEAAAAGNPLSAGSAGNDVPTLAPLGGVEGPLPPDVRRLIAQSCTSRHGGGPDAATQEAAEQQARRLISTGRRVKVYREELAAAEEERRDWAASTEQRRLVRSVLQTEMDDINARIQALLQERAICEVQLRAEDEAAAKEIQQLAEAEQRVAVLRRTIDGIVEETVVPRLMLQQLVPSLLIENYI